MKIVHRIFFYLGIIATIYCLYMVQTEYQTAPLSSAPDFSLLGIALAFVGLFIFFYVYAVIRSIANLIVRRHKPFIAWIVLILVPFFGPYLYFEKFIFPSRSNTSEPKVDYFPNIQVSTQTTLRRAFAASIDYGLFISFVSLYIVLQGQETTPGTYQLSGAPHAILILAVWLVYFPVPESIWGQTLGKAIFGLKVFTPQGTKANFTATLKRHLLDFPDLIIVGAIAAITLQQGPPRRLGDRWARTVVAAKSHNFGSAARTDLGPRPTCAA